MSQSAGGIEQVFVAALDGLEGAAAEVVAVFRAESVPAALVERAVSGWRR